MCLSSKKKSWITKRTILNPVRRKWKIEGLPIMDKMSLRHRHPKRKLKPTSPRAMRPNCVSVQLETCNFCNRIGHTIKSASAFPSFVHSF